MSKEPRPFDGRHIKMWSSYYTAVHRWLNREYPRNGTCERCSQTEKPTEYANISGEYKADRADFEELCHRCHMISDGRIGPKSKEVRESMSRGQRRRISERQMDHV